MSLLKTKYDNQDKDSIISELRFMAEQKRREAEILLKQADAIDEVRIKLDLNLKDYDEANP